MFILILLLILLVILGISYYTYRVVFYGHVEAKTDDDLLPKLTQYRPYLDAIRSYILETADIPYEEVWITSHDGLKLFGRYYHVKGGAPLQIQFHGYKSCASLDFCGGGKLARQAGHNTIVVDQRSHENSEGHTITFGIEERKDCLDWIRYAMERFGNETQIILCGVSMGAATVLMASDLGLPKNVIGIIADCPYSSPKKIIKKVCKDIKFPADLLYPFVKLGAFLFGHFHLEESDAVTAVTKTNIPILIFHGNEDYFVPCEMSQELKQANPNITFITIDKAGHGLCYLVDPILYEEETMHFLERILS